MLVGHSYGGAVITDAATGNANVKELVYIDAFAPDQGQAVTQLVGPTSVLANPDPTKVFPSYRRHHSIPTCMSYRACSSAR